MSKKIKIAYWIIGASNAVVCIVEIAMANYFGAALSGISLIWLGVCYILAKIICEQDVLINSLLKQLKEYAQDLDESAIREKLHHQELNKMRERAQKAEKQLQQLIDDTPARGEDGRYVKRENL